MLLLILGAILYVKGNIHWSYYKYNFENDDIDFFEYMNSIPGLSETTAKVFTFYGPFFRRSLFEKKTDENKKRKRGIHICLAFWWIILIITIINLLKPLL